MKGFLISGSGWEWLILLMFFLAFGVPIILLIIAASLKNKNERASKILLIITAVYTLIGLGVCGSSMI